MSNENLNKRQFTLLQGEKSERDKCACNEPDVYDGWAQCPVHPDGQG